MADFIDAVIELVPVDLRYRPEVNTIEALAESDFSENAPFAEPIWTATPEGYYFLWVLGFVNGAALVGLTSSVLIE